MTAIDKDPFGIRHVMDGIIDKFKEQLNTNPVYADSMILSVEDFHEVMLDTVKCCICGMEIEGLIFCETEDEDGTANSNAVCTYTGSVLVLSCICPHCGEVNTFND